MYMYVYVFTYIYIYIYVWSGVWHPPPPIVWSGRGEGGGWGRGGLAGAERGRLLAGQWSQRGQGSYASPTQTLQRRANAGRVPVFTNLNLYLML